jgi:F-type H+-transporting ATPase subunit epsilon
MATMHVDIVSAEREIWSGEATMVIASAEGGEIGIMPRHSPLITRLQPGEVRVKLENGEEQNIYVSGGVLEVQPHVVTVLSDTAERAEDLDEVAALESKRLAEQSLKDSQSEIDRAKALADLANSAAQLRAIDRIRKRSR